MPSGRTTEKALLGAAVLGWCVLAHAGAQTCTINSAAAGPLSCTVATTVTATIHMPALVSVRATSANGTASAPDLAFAITANTVYALEIAPSAESGGLVGDQASGITDRVDSPAHRVVIMPTRRFSPSESMGNHSGRLVAFSLGARRAADPRRVVLTIAAP